MSRGTFNRAILIGRLGKDPELRYTTSGIPITSFSLATGQSYKDKEGKVVEQTDWHKIVAWRKLAEICGQYLKKGSLVCVEGQLKTRYYDDKDGVKRSVTEVVVETLQMLGAKMESDKSPEPEVPVAELAVETVGNEGMPF